MQPGRDPAGRADRQLAREGGHERGPAGAVDRPRTAQVTVELAALEEVGERELLDDRGAEVVRCLGRDDGVGEPVGNDHPAEPQPRRERLADRAGVQHAVGREALHGTDRRAVVAVLGVVVVLQHEGAGAGGPVDQGGPTRRGQDDPERELVGGRSEHRAGGELLEPVDAQAVRVHRHGQHLESVGDQLLAPRRAGRVLHPDAPCAAGDERAGEERHALRHAGSDHDALGVAVHAAGAAEVARQGDAQLGRAARVAVVEPGVGCVAQRAPQRPEPGRAREQRHVGAARAVVEARRLVGARSGDRQRRGDGRLRHAGRRALGGDQVALRAELGVGVDDHSPRHAELARERARRRQRDAGRQASRAHSVAQLLLDLGPQGRRAALYPHQQVKGTGPIHRG